MFGKRCQLCGGKLVGNKCTLCGLDNSKSDANYKLNQSSCDGKPLTHVHTENPQRTVQKKNATKSHTLKNDIPRMAEPVKIGKKKSKKWVVIVVVVIFLIKILGKIDFQEIFPESILDTFGKLTGGSRDYEDDWYAYTERELSDIGENYEVTLEPGTYIVGVHIPEGTYTVRESAKETYDGIYIEDSENRIYIGISFNDDRKKESVEDVRCYTGAKLSIRGNVEFSSENAQVDDMKGVDNPLTETAQVKNGDIAGKDFPAGTYDIVAEEGDLSFAYIVPGTVRNDPEDEYESVTERIWIDTYSGTFVKRNIYLPEGTEIRMDEGTVELIPSEKIPESYEGYYYIYE